MRLTILALLTLSVVVFCATFQIVVVPTASMESTVLVGDHLLVNRMAYRWNRVKRGDVISFLAPTHLGQVYLKRVVAVGGDNVEFRDGAVYVNGAPLPEPQNQHYNGTYAGRVQTLRVATGQLYVLGDNRNHSEDSRSWGTVAENRVVGAPVMVLWSFAIPTERWMRSTPVALYLDHPLAHLRRSRLLRPLQ